MVVMVLLSRRRGRSAVVVALARTGVLVVTVVVTNVGPVTPSAVSYEQRIKTTAVPS